MKAVILLAVYNGATFLRAQLDSIRTQTDTDFTVYMQDDGSSDDSLSILRSCCETDERFILSPDGGRHLGAASNFFDLLLHAPQADLYFFCDQDDIWRPDKLQCIKSTMKDAAGHYGKNTPLLVHSDAALTDEVSSGTHDSFFRHQKWDPDAVSIEKLLVQNNVTGCTMAINDPLRQIIKKASRLPGSFHDWFIAQTASAFGHIIFIDAPLIFYRQHDSNTIGASRKNIPGRIIASLSGNGKARIRLTYTMADALYNAYSDLLPAESKRKICTYLSTGTKCKPARIYALIKGGYLMQSPVLRIGQMIFC